jgi:PBSX family phage terminase large subunit
LEINLNEKYNLLGSESRYFVITGGRGSGKSYSLNSFLLLLTYEVGHVILFTRYTLTSANVSIIPEFIDKIESADLTNDFYITKDEIVNLRTGSKILFKGIKTSSGTQTANLKSLAGVTTWVLDEAEELTDEETFEKIDFSIRTKGIQNRVLLVLNPATKEHFIYKKFFEDKGIQAGSNLIKGDTSKKAKPNENQWYTAQDPSSVKNPKGFRIFVKKFGQNPIDPIKDQEFLEFKNYFVEYPTQQDADTKFNEFYNKLITKQTTPQQNNSTTTTTTLKPGTTPSVSGTTNSSSATSSEISRDELIGYMSKNLDTMGVGKKTT